MVEGEETLRRSDFPLTVRQPEPESDNSIRIDPDTKLL